MARHDPQRTAASTGQSALERPTIAWRTYLGGSLGAQQVFAANVDGNGTGDVVILWQAPRGQALRRLDPVGDAPPSTSFASTRCATSTTTARSTSWPRGARGA